MAAGLIDDDRRRMLDERWCIKQDINRCARWAAELSMTSPGTRSAMTYVWRCKQQWRTCDAVRSNDAILAGKMTLIVKNHQTVRDISTRLQCITVLHEIQVTLRLLWDFRADLWLTRNNWQSEYIKIYLHFRITHKVLRFVILREYKYFM